MLNTETKVQIRDYLKKCGFKSVQFRNRNKKSYMVVKTESTFLLQEGSHPISDAFHKTDVSACLISNTDHSATYRLCKRIDKLEDWKKRLIIEHNDLLLKYNKLRKFIQSKKFENLDYAEQVIISDQYSAMYVYGLSLAKRLLLHKLDSFSGV